MREKWRGDSRLTKKYEVEHIAYPSFNFLTRFAVNRV